MDVRAALRETLADRIERSLDGQGQVYRVDDPAELAPPRDRLAVAVFDARQLIDQRATPVLTRLGADPAVALIAYADLSAAGTAGVASAATFGLEGVILEGLDDDPVTLRARLHHAQRSALVSALLRNLADALGALPPPVALAIEQLFRRTRAPQDVEELVRQSGVGRRAFDRALESAGLAPAGHCIRAARVLNAYFAIRMEGLRVSDVASKLRFGRTTVFADHVEMATGASLADFKCLLPRGLVDALAHRVRRHATLA